MVLAAAVWFFLMTSRMDVMLWRLVDVGCRAHVEKNEAPTERRRRNQRRTSECRRREGQGVVR